MSVLALMLGACDSSDTILVVDLLTDLRAGVEYDRVEVALVRGNDRVGLAMPERSAPSFGVMLTPEGEQSFRVAEFESLPQGIWLLQTRALNGMTEVGESLVLVDVRGVSQTVTARITRDCLDVSCPGDGSPMATTCLAGLCVDPRCAPETPEYCPAPECVLDTDCVVGAGQPACATGRCLAGVCGEVLDDALCSAGICEPISGCTTEPGGIVELALGTQHSCALQSDGQVYCWGSGALGQLGHGSDEASSSAVLVSGLNDAVQLSAGRRHTCALRATGSVVCWGDNESGQLGVSGGARNVPVEVPLAGGAVQVSAGGSHTCVRQPTGTALCWGENGDGQLGDGGMVSRVAPTPTGVTDAIDLSAGLAHTCALRRSGEVVCWGNNDEGQLGDGSFVDHFVPGPVDLPAAPLDTVELGTGGTHTCARQGDGSLYCWGNNVNGQLGAGTFTQPQATPSLVEGLPRVGQVVLGLDHTCALDEAGSLRCWGAGRGGQLGDGQTDDRSTPELVFGLVGVIAFDAGATHTCAAQTDGGVFCWGDNDQGELGSGEVSLRVTPVPTLGLADAVELSVGFQHNCAVRGNGETVCWGANVSGQLGDGTQTSRSIPTLVPGAVDVRQVAAGMNHTCARIDFDAGVLCWGDNARGQLGSGAGPLRSVPTQIVTIDSIAHLRAGYRHNCAIDTSGGLLCWGANSSGQVGGFELVDRPTPFVLDGFPVQQVVGGGAHTCSLSAGDIRCWGSNTRGQLGDGTRIDRAGSMVVAGLSNVQEVTAGEDHTCARLDTGSVNCWGRNDFAQLGDGTQEEHLLPVAVMGLSDAVELSAGRLHTCARRATGEVVCWGAAAVGQLGDGGLRNRSVTPVLVIGVNDAVEIGAGNLHTCARRSGGEVVCWGSNQLGQLGERALWLPERVLGL